MGVDYDEVAGIGYKVGAKEKAEELYAKEYGEEEEFSLHEYIEWMESDEYEYGQIGSAYSGDYEYYVFIKIKDPLIDLDNLEEKKKALLKYIEDNGLYTKGEFNLHIGINVW